MQDMQKLLVLGIGNILLKDEGAGVYAVQALSRETWPDGLVFVSGETSSFDFLAAFQEYGNLLVVDAVKADSPPGTIHRVLGENLLREEPQPVSVHGLSLLDTLELAEALGFKPRLRIVGIEPGEIGWGMQMTSELEAALPQLMEAVRKEIWEFLTPV